MPRTPSLPIFALAVVSISALGAVCTHVTPPVLPQLPELAPGAELSYRDQVQPVLENRCVVCHGCYDAPCQLLLSSHAGLERGGSKQAVYHSDRLTPAAPSRLFVDAETAEEWRERGFFSVLEGPASAPEIPLLLQMLALGRAHPFAPDEPLPKTLALDITRELTCPTAREFGSYARKSPLGGMPYGTAPLSDAELAVLVAWVDRGAPPPPAAAPLSKPLAGRVKRWEEFLNGDSLKARITARYVYEHWFLAYLYFDDRPEGPFFRVVRSSTPPGSTVREIPTRRPNDDPGSERFWYRLRPIDSTIVHKTHIVYELSAARMRRLSELFLESDWEPRRLPGYDPHEASNPFVSFEEMPARSRYQFLLDDAHYFLMNFIRGPVCHGQVAVDVIEDHFFVTFLDPDYDMSVVDPTYLERTKKLLRLPGEHEDWPPPGGLWLQYDLEQRRYLEVREQAYDAHDPELLGPTLGAIWDGEGRDRDALLTVFRNFDNAAVVRGFIGSIPETAWVLDFPLLERIYYALVADFDVFGNVAHQVATRLYMDHLRMQAENLFLAFLPEERREEIRASWYVGATDKVGYRTNRIRSTGHGTQVVFESADVVSELLEKILAKNAAISGPPDLINRCASPPCDRAHASRVERRAERALQGLAGVHGPWVAALPELGILRVRSERADEKDAAYTFVHNRAHTNVASMFDEDERLDPEKDTLTVVRGYLGSYPNFLFEVDVAEVGEFAEALKALAGASDFQALVERWGVRRTSPRFWSTFDWVHQDFRKRQPTEAGLFDLARYENW